MVFAQTAICAGSSGTTTMAPSSMPVITSAAIWSGVYVDFSINRAATWATVVSLPSMELARLVRKKPGQTAVTRMP